MTNTEMIIAERDMLFSLLCRIARGAYMMKPGSTSPNTAGDALIYLQLSHADYDRIRDLQYRQALTDAGLNAIPTGTPA
jgi:hypothetical protein